MTQITNDTKTDWFPGDIKPVRAGVYQVTKTYGIAWAHWDGRTWSHGYRRSILPETAPEFIHNKYAYPIIRWRGLNREV